MHGLRVFSRGPVHRHIEIKKDALRVLGADIYSDVGKVNISVDYFGLQTRN